MRKLLAAVAAGGLLLSFGDAGLARQGPRPRPAPQNPARGDDGYFSPYLTGAGGRKVPLNEYPGAATVITRKMMDDIQARSLCDALRYAPGVWVGGCW